MTADYEWCNGVTYFFRLRVLMTARVLVEVIAWPPYIAQRGVFDSHTENLFVYLKYIFSKLPNKRNAYISKL